MEILNKTYCEWTLLDSLKMLAIIIIIYFIYYFIIDLYKKINK